MNLFFEVDLVHGLWEKFSERTKVLDVASCAGERKILALILENRRLEKWGTYDQYNRLYLPAIQDLHAQHYEHCLELASKIEVRKDFEEMELIWTQITNDGNKE